MVLLRIYDITHDVKVAPDLVDKINLRNIDILCADKSYNSDGLR